MSKRKLDNVVVKLRRRVCVEIRIWELLANTSYLKPLLLVLDFFPFKCQADLVLVYLVSF